MNRKPTNKELLKRIKELEKKVFERQYAEEELQKSKRMLKVILDSLPFDVFALDWTGHYFLQNSICKNNWGNLIGKCPEDLPVSKETLNLWKDNNRRAFSGEIVTGEVEYDTLEGRKHFYHNVIAPIKVEEEIYGILGVLVDISDRKQMEESLKTALKVKEILMGEIHHRVKNNFEIISSLLDLSSMHTRDQE
ncbi:MAG: histidine kinase dimerization/phosphoacceptor domain -containing protein, partial [Deinococcales bacterium]